METMKQMLKRHSEEIEDFRNKCPHKHTVVGEYYWAIAHGTGRFYLWCKDCNKQLEEVHSDGSPLKEGEICKIHNQKNPCFICEAQKKMKEK